MFDTLTEIWYSIRSHKTRVTITGISVAWAIFLLIFLMGAGGSVVSNITDMVGLDTLCIFTIQPGVTQKSWNGYESQRTVELTTHDIELLQARFPNQIRSVEGICEGPSGYVCYGNNQTVGQLMGVTQQYLATQKHFITIGSDLTNISFERHEKTCIIPDNMYNILMPDQTDPHGLEIQICGEVFTVVGVYKHVIAQKLPSHILIPITTAHDLFNQRDMLKMLYVINDETMTNSDDISAYTHDMVQLLSNEHQFDPDDAAALECCCTSLHSLKILQSMKYINLFIWFICLSALLIGITGISNIMLISIKERTREFGVRKVMGASDGSILSLILGESISVTMLFGYVGVVAGLGFLWLANILTSQLTGSAPFAHATISLDFILSVVSILVATGILAGLFPAMCAFKMKPIDALNS